LKNAQSLFMQVRLQGVSTYRKKENKFLATGDSVSSSNNKFPFRILHIERVSWQYWYSYQYNIKLPTYVIHYSNCSCFVLL